MEDKQYRTRQFNRLSTRPSEYRKTLCINDSEGGHTNWLNITDEELKAIQDILTK